MILKVNNNEFKDFLFNERYLVENKIEVYSLIKYKNMSEARELMENISSKENIIIELLKDDKNSIIKYEAKTSEVYREIGIDNNEFVVTLSYITSKN